ncbi:MAG: MFS transporter [Nocardioides sp.]
MVAWFGVVSLAADMVYEGARSVTGPYLASLGASALLVGLVTGAGEAAALGFRLFSGPLADQSGRYWSWTVVGYAMTVVCVPLMAVAPFAGGAGLALAATFVILERTGKAVRSPSKSVLLADAARTVGRGRGFAVHKALDQVGAFAGPLLVAGMLAVTGVTWPGLAVLAIPGVVAMVLLLRLRVALTAPGPRPEVDDVPDGPLPRSYRLLTLSCALATFGLLTFGVLSFHLVDDGLLDVAWVPVVYAAAMGVEAVSALATGFVFDRIGGRTLVVLPFLVAVVPFLAFSSSLTMAVAGILVWGLATGILDSTVKAMVAETVPRSRLGTAYGAFAAVQGVAALAGGGVAGWLYPHGRLPIVTVVGVAQLAALVLLLAALRPGRSSAATSLGRG